MERRFFRILLLLTGSILLMTACGRRNSTRKVIGGADAETSIVLQENRKTGSAALKAEEFTVPSVPSYLQEPAAQAEFISRHFWDNLDMTDSTMISRNSRAIVEYIGILEQLPLEKGVAALDALLKKTEPHEEVSAYFLGKLKLLLMDPNSPIRNDELYEPVCRFIIAHASELDSEKFQAELELKFIQMNRRGTVANDFVARDRSGRNVRMHKVMSPYTLVVFFNPDCHGCDESMAYLKASAVLNSAPVKAQLKVVAVYVDQSPDIWERAKDMIPEDWICLWDQEGRLRQNEVYDLKAIPTLFLLDAEKRVLLKDATLPGVENYFVQLFGAQ